MENKDLFDIRKKMNANKKQTALEWFFDNLKNHAIQAEYFELYELAKEIEKNQIETSYLDGFMKSTNIYNGENCDEDLEDWPENYYKIFYSHND